MSALSAFYAELGEEVPRLNVIATALVSLATSLAVLARAYTKRPCAWWTDAISNEALGGITSITPARSKIPGRSSLR
jgi:hypothetical protein